MKATLILLVGLSSFLGVVRATEAEEMEFQSRLVAFTKAADMGLADTVYARGETPQKELFGTISHLEATIVRGIKKVSFEDIPPRIKDRLSGPIEIEGKAFLPNLIPYRMVTIEFEVPIKSGSSDTPHDHLRSW